MAAVAELPAATSSTQLYLQSLALLRQQKFEDAFIVAKRALDGAHAGSGLRAAANISSGMACGMVCC